MMTSAMRLLATKVSLESHHLRLFGSSAFFEKWKASEITAIKDFQSASEAMYGPRLKQRINEQAPKNIPRSNSSKNEMVSNSKERPLILNATKSQSDSESVSRSSNVKSKRQVPVVHSERNTGNFDFVAKFPLVPSAETDSSMSTDILTLLGGQRVPSVGTILRETMSPEAKAVLDRWMKKKVAELGEVGFQKYQQELFSSGQNFHECIAAFLSGAPDIALSPANENLWSSVDSIFTDICDVKYVETRVTHSPLGYMGIFDCVAVHKNNLCVLDWKTSEKSKSRLEYTYDNPLQLAAYVGALNADPNYEQTIDRAVLVIAYRDGRPAHVHEINRHMCEQYWNQWLLRLRTYWTNRAAQHGAV